MRFISPFLLGSQTPTFTVLVLPLQINVAWQEGPEDRPIDMNLTGSCKCLLPGVLSVNSKHFCCKSILSVCTPPFFFFFFNLWVIRMDNRCLVISSLYRNLWDAWESQGLRWLHGGCETRQCLADLWKLLVDLPSGLLTRASAVKTERKTVWVRWLKTTADTAFEAVQIPYGITQLKGIKVLVLLLLKLLPKLLLAGEEEAWTGWCCQPQLSKGCSFLWKLCPKRRQEVNSVWMAGSVH